MAETEKKEVAAEKKLRKKDLRPTNCAQSNKRIRRKDWYYRNGKFFANKKSFKLYVTAQAEAAAKAAKAAAPAQEEKAS
ncbi:MAG: hypothetical protein HY592_01480 [Candidatus Omnitrophica bacterium]|nr:hypothetical protein [Candidatus Omnitrophota bacterium]